jgi:F0F1-type ATP synthase assembly protein I
VKSLAPVLAAGGTFAASALAGLAVGILIDSRTGHSWWAFAGLMLGLAVGAFSAFRLLQQSL